MQGSRCRVFESVLTSSAATRKVYRQSSHTELRFADDVVTEVNTAGSHSTGTAGTASWVYCEDSAAPIGNHTRHPPIRACVGGSGALQTCQ